MAENKILPWAQTGTANVLSDADYASDVASGGLYGDGVKSGQASSKQANKTWRQATAPASGLGQFLVDNLSVDVTDADTPATFSSRIANAVLKLAQISPFNQAWATATGGYRKYAIVSDSSGNFWVSTADQNTTTPGASGAKWQSLFDGYATNEALKTETTNRTNADTNLQNQINGRVLKSGDTINWLNCNGEITVRGSNPKTNNGDWNYSPGISFGYDGRATVDLFVQEQVGDHTDVVIRSLFGGNELQYWWFNQGGNITSSSKGPVAFRTDISNLQNQINGKQASGDYVIHSEFPCNLSGNGWQKLPSGLIIQWGQTSSNGTYSFPTTFPNGCFCIVPGNTTSQGSYVDNAFAYAVNNSQFYIATKASNTGTVTNFPASWFALGH